MENNGYLLAALEIREQIKILIARYNTLLMLGNNENQDKEECLPRCDVEWVYPE